MKALILIVCLLGLGAIVGAVVVGTRSFDGTVVEHPYEHGLAWDRDQGRRRDSGLEVRVLNTAFRTGSNLAAFTISGVGADGIGDRDVTVRVRRPASAEHERTTPARKQSDGSWAAEALLPVAGRWELAVLVERPGGRIDFPAAITVSGGGGGVVATAADGCDLNRGPCRLALPGGAGSLTVEISPRPIRTMRDLEFSVRLSCASPPCAPQDVSVALTMPGMYMGENTVTLAPGEEAGLYRGRGTIVRCPSGRSLWKATVKAPPLGEAAVTFETDRP
jgi:nitrogen fixation protein FixH